MIQKFRAWHVHKQVMCEVIRIDFKLGIVTLDLEPDDDEYYWTETDWNISHVILMQSTGLKDKNGVEIFEGDIVKITNTERFCGKNYTCYSEIKKIDGHIYVWPHPVVDGEIKRFGAKLLFSGMAKYIKDNGVATEDVEVIGNIYENPELLEAHT